jgi:hypothetical protein
MPATIQIDAAARLAGLTARVAPDQRATARQDGLDLLAVAVGFKPVAVLGRDFIDDGWLSGAAAIARELGLTVEPGAYWDPARDDGHGLSEWYEAAVAARRARQSALYVWRDPALGDRVRQACVRGRVTVAEEAALLGYPECCVAQHHAQALALERLTVAAIARQAGDDDAQRHRLAAAAVIPMPRSRAEWQQLEAALAIAPEPDTSVNRCVACGADPDGRAGRLGRRYRELAHALAYPAPAAAA